MAKYSQTTLSLNDEELKAVNALKKQGFTIIDIFRAGIDDLTARTPKKLF